MKEPEVMEHNLVDCNYISESDENEDSDEDTKWG